MPGEPATATTSSSRSPSRKRGGASTHSNESRPKRARTRTDASSSSHVAESSQSAVSVRRRRSKRSLKGKGKTSSDHEENDNNNEDKVEVKEVEAIVASSPASTNTGTSQSNEGNTSATSVESEDTELSRAQKEISLKDEVCKPNKHVLCHIMLTSYSDHSKTKRHIRFPSKCAAMPNMFRTNVAPILVSSFHSMLSCSSGKLTRPMAMLFSLTPCGHVACESCLVSWFSQPSQHEVDIEMPLIMPELRKKTCPTCRTEIRSRPVVAYIVKSALQAVLPCLDPSTYDKADAEESGSRLEDPWKGVFPSDEFERRRDAHGDVLIDDEDGVARCRRCLHEVFDHVCTGCGHYYDDLSDDSGDDDLDAGVYGNPYGLGIAMGMPGWPYGNHSDAEHDESEGSEEPYESDFIDDEGEGPLATGDEPWNHSDDEPIPYLPHRNPPRQNRPGRLQAVHFLESDDDPPHQDGVEPQHRHRSEPIDITGDSDAESDWVTRPRHERLAAQARRAGGSNDRRHSVVIISSDDDNNTDDDDHSAPAFFSAEEDEGPTPVAGPSRRTRRQVHIISDSEDEDRVVRDVETSDGDRFEDAASSTERTSTSVDQHSPRLDLSDHEQEDDFLPRRQRSWNSDEEHDEMSSPPLGPYSGLMHHSDDEDENSEMDGYSSDGSLD